jgi:HK97 family phage prohead protease
LNKHLTFSAVIEAADTQRRVIAGQIVPFGEIGNTSAGKVIFEKGSIQVPNVSKIKLLAQHQQTASGVIGRAQSINETSTGMNGVFKVSASADGENFLIKASEGILDGLSVGVDVIRATERKDGVLIVKAAILKEVSLVETPAFDAARVVEVAAQAEDDAAEEKLEEMEDEQIQKISEAVDALKVIQEAEKALEQTETETESEAPVDNTTPAATEAAKVEDASRPTIQAAATPYISTTVRHGITSAGKYIEHKLKAATGNAESAEWIAASEDARNLTAATDSIGTTNPAFNPIQYLNNFVSNTNFGRSTIDAVTKGALPSSGMQINIPSLVTSAGGGSSVAPTVATTGEDVAPSSTGMTSAYETVAVQKFAGSQVITLELLERSDPVFFDQLAIQLKRAYDKATDAYMVNVLATQGTQASVSAGTTAADFQAFIATEVPQAYSGSSYFASNLAVSPQWWGKLQSYADTTGRPIYTLASPQFNAAGQVLPTSIKGQALGLDVYVDKFITGTSTGLDDDSMFVIAPETAMWWESPTAYFSVNHVADATGNMALQTAIYGYGAGKVLIPAGVRRFNI